MKISQAAFDLIWDDETGGAGYYKATRECSADWPGGASGVTIGGFYDLGYVTHDELRRDWGDKLPAAMIDRLEDVIGITGFPARSHACELHGAVSVPIEAAMSVFTDREIPKWEAIVARDLPNADKLSGDCFGALVSLALNRGDSFSTPRRAGDAVDRYREMRMIRAAMAACDFKAIPAWIRSMKRLWPLGSIDHNGLTKRREDEATLFEKGLAQT